tara:strand:- start:828 stop:1142 length:315 start_codon:yes stop_codon:yes gene_type:complete
MFDISQDENMTTSTLDKYKSVIKDNSGSIHRLEDWGIMKLAYLINKNNKARYYLINFESTSKVIDELTNLIKFNDNIIRHLFLIQDEKTTEPSVMMQSKEKEKA